MLKIIGWKTFKILCCGAAFVGGCAGPITPHNEFSHDAIIRDFIYLTAYGEMNQNIGTGVRKWVSPIQAHIDPAAPQEMAERIRNHLIFLGTLSRLPISFTSKKSANFIVHTPKQAAISALLKQNDFTARNDRRLRRRLARANCFFSLHVDSKMAIRRANVVIPRDLPASKRNHCIVEELTQSFGLINDFSGNQDSVFNENRKYAALNTRDRIFVSLLYHTGIPPGASRQQITNIILKLLIKCFPVKKGATSLSEQAAQVFLSCIYSL